MDRSVHINVHLRRTLDHRARREQSNSAVKTQGGHFVGKKSAWPNRIELQLYMRINGIRQWNSIRGTDLRHTIRPVLHGGPDSPATPAAWSCQRLRDDHFTVVEWEQRGTGKTFAAHTRG